MEKNTKEQKCIRRGYCCRSAPGWFAPGEVEKAAAHLEMKADDFVRQYLVIDGIDVEGHGWVDVFVPVRLNKMGEPALPPLHRVDNIYRYFDGPCIFYQNQNCRLHPHHPLECRRYFCGQPEEKNISHKEIALLWVAGKNLKS